MDLMKSAQSEDLPKGLLEKSEDCTPKSTRISWWNWMNRIEIEEVRLSLTQTDLCPDPKSSVQTEHITSTWFELKVEQNRDCVKGNL